MTERLLDFTWRILLLSGLSVIAFAFAVPAQANLAPSCDISQGVDVLLDSDDGLECGAGTTASGANSTAIGNATTAQGDNSLAVGDRASSAADGATSVGQFA